MASGTQTSQRRKRIAKSCPNPLFEKWLDEWRKEAQERGLNSVHTYRKALHSLRQHPLPLRNGQEAKQLPNFGDGLARMLNKKIQEHSDALGGVDILDTPQCTTDSNPTPAVHSSSVQLTSAPAVSIREEPLSPVKKKRKITSREYVPLYRSGGYAVLIALLRAKQTAGYTGCMVKKDLQKAAQPFCDASFTIPEPGSHYTAWCSVSTLIKKQLLIKSGTVPAKYTLTEAGLELAQKLAQVDHSSENGPSMSDNGCSSSSSMAALQHSACGKETSRVERDATSGQCLLASQEVGEDLETDLQKPWLLGQERIYLTNKGSANKNSSISSKEKLIHVKEVSYDRPEPKSDNATPCGRYEDIAVVLSSELPSNCVAHSSVQSDASSGNGPQFWYVDNEDSLVLEKNKAAILFNSETFSTSFLVKYPRNALDSAGWRYTLDKSRSCDADYVYAYVTDLDAPELCTPPSNGVSFLTACHAATSLTSALSHTSDHSIVMLSSDSEDDDLPPLSQRIVVNGAVTSSNNCSSSSVVERVTGMEKDKVSLPVQQGETRNGVSAALRMAGLAALRRSGHISSTAVMATARADVITTTTAASEHTKRTINNDVIGRNVLATVNHSQENLMKSQAHLMDKSSPPSSGSAEDHSGCSRCVLKPGEYEVVLYIDNVEANNKSNVCGVLLAELSKNGVECKVCKLQIGDFLWVARKSSATGQSTELVLDHIVERKRMDDLSKSIIDKRFYEQKFRLNNCGINHIVYLIEEFGDAGRFSIPAGTLNQAITNTQIIDGFYIRRTQNIKDTVTYLTIMTKCLQKHYSGVTLEEHSVDCVTSAGRQSLPITATTDEVVQLMSFSAFSAATVKSKVMTVTEMFAKHLIQVPGFSADKAEAVIALYPTPTSLFEAYKQCSSPEKRLLLLENIKHGRRNRNLGKSLSTLVHDLYWSGQLSS